MNRQVWRVIGSHAGAAVGMGLPWPMLLIVVEDSTTSHVLLGLAGAALVVEVLSPGATLGYYKAP